MIAHAHRSPMTSTCTNGQGSGHADLAGPPARHQNAADRNPSRREPEWPAEDVGEYAFATVNDRYEVHVVRRDAGAWAVRLGGFALHADGCFWTARDAHPDGSVDRAEPTFPLDEAIARALRALARLP